MNCREFETMAHDLARDRETDATTRQNAALHSEHCAGCARRLADERSLATGLRSLAANVAHREAPPRVEAALLEAFRGQSKAAPSPAVTAKRGFPLRLRWVAAAAAAAAALLIFALSASRVEQQMPSEEIQARENKPVPTEKKDKDEPTIKRDQKTPPKKKRLVLLRAHLASNKTVKKKPPTDQSEQQGAGDEIATRFLPFTFAGSFEQMDGGQLVRVEIPRSALVSFGLPMNIERADERIKADVLIGNDGVARAIRFVR